MILSNAQYGPTSVNWRLKENEEIKACEDYEDYVPAAAFVRYNHNMVTLSLRESRKGKDICHYVNSGLSAADDENEIFLKQPFEIKIWNAVQKLIPSFGDYKKIDISSNFIGSVFSPIIPDSPAIALTKDKRTALRISAYILLLIEIPIRHFGVFIICRAMNLYALYQPDFAEYYKFRAKINSNHPLNVLIREVYCSLLLKNQL